MSFYYNAVGQRFGLPERPLEPPEDWEDAQEECPFCQCSKCEQEICPGEYAYGDGGKDKLCRECFLKLLHDMIDHNLNESAELLGYDVNLTGG